MKNNKKGFTLVELIVVISIMAVLAGTISSVTIVELNKQKDRNNYDVQASLYAKSIAACLYEGNLEKPDFYGDTEDTKDKYDADKIMNYLKSEAVGAQDVDWGAVNSTPAKGQFALYVNQSGDLIYIAYTGKRDNFGTKYYVINTNGSYHKTDAVNLATESL